MRALSRFGARGALLGGIWVAMTLGSCTPPARHGGGPSLPGRSFVLAPEQAHYGATYAEWSEIWWKWEMEHPYTNHPLYDPTGAHALEWQTDPVWFLGGIVGTAIQPTTGSAVRDITIPSDIALFFPIINYEWDNQICLPADWLPRSLTELRQLAFDTVNAVQDVYCEIDGDSIINSPDLAGAIRYRAMADGFTAQWPADNPTTALGCIPMGAALIDPIASDGIWMMIAPLPPGGHTLRFGGTFPATPTSAYFHLDITYHITVTP